jgi:hypothetical protein
MDKREWIGWLAFGCLFVGITSILGIETDESNRGIWFTAVGGAFAVVFFALAPKPVPYAAEATVVIGVALFAFGLSGFHGTKTNKLANDRAAGFPAESRVHISLGAALGVSGLLLRRKR